MPPGLTVKPTVLNMFQEEETKMPRLTRRLLLCVAGTAGLLHGLAIAVRAAAPVDVSVFRNPGCGCCEAWAKRMTDAGFAVTMTDDPALAERRARLGIPAELAGCHLSLIGDKVFEGHIPPADIVAFLTAESEAWELAVPGMPVGSPGMETGGEAEAYDVILLGRDGSRAVFATH
jgi:hypothetical protein